MDEKSRPFMQVSLLPEQGTLVQSTSFTRAKSVVAPEGLSLYVDSLNLRSNPTPASPHPPFLLPMMWANVPKALLRASLPSLTASGATGSGLFKVFWNFPQTFISTAFLDSQLQPSGSPCSVSPVVELPPPLSPTSPFISFLCTSGQRTWVLVQSLGLRPRSHYSSSLSPISPCMSDLRDSFIGSLPTLSSGRSTSALAFPLGHRTRFSFVFLQHLQFIV